MNTLGTVAISACYIGRWTGEDTLRRTGLWGRKPLLYAAGTPAIGVGRPYCRLSELSGII